MSNIANIVANGIAGPVYLVDANGNPISSAYPLSINLAQIGGAAMSITNPDITESNILNAIRAGQGFIANTGQMSSATGTNNTPLSIFNPSTSGKNILVYSFTASSGTAGGSSIAAYLAATTSDPAYGSTATITNNKAGGSSSAIASNCTFTTTSQSIPGGIIETMYNTAPIELIAPGTAILLPSGSNHGLTLFMQTYANGIGAIMARWIEY
jgi:hypothetical protein